MFEIMFKTPALVARHENGPFPQERFRFLHSLMQTGYQPHTIYCACHELLRVALALRRSHSRLALTLSQIDRAVKGHRQQDGIRLPPSSMKFRGVPTRVCADTISDPVGKSKSVQRSKGCGNRSACSTPCSVGRTVPIDLGALAIMAPDLK
jgi:hypothetical protein